MELTKERRAANKAVFLDRLRSVKRIGMPELCDYIAEETDFFEAPASTKYHGNFEGGLCEHSLCVYEQLIYKANNDPFWASRLSKTHRDSLCIVSLLHDICKIRTYEKYYRNVKVYIDKETPISRQDSHGIYEWQEVEAYRGNYNSLLPHAEQSVALITSFMTLTAEEKMAIRYHMGFSEPKETWTYMNNALEKYPLVLALQQADMEAAHYLENTAK